MSVAVVAERTWACPEEQPAVITQSRRRYLHSLQASLLLRVSLVRVVEKGSGRSGWWLGLAEMIDINPPGVSNSNNPKHHSEQSLFARFSSNTPFCLLLNWPHFAEIKRKHRGSKGANFILKLNPASEQDLHS